MEKGDFAASVPWLENIVSSSFCSLEHVPNVQILSPPLFLSLCSYVSHPFAQRTQALVGGNTFFSPPISPSPLAIPINAY